MQKRWIAAGLAVLAAGLGSPSARAQEHDADWVARRVEQIKGSDKVEWRKIPWAASLTEARRLSQQEQRPVFLFTHDGNIATGRC